MSDIKLGTLITGIANRDAIHVAIAPTVASQWLAPGEHVGLTADGRASSGKGMKLIGIVDPFLKARVQPGDTFYLMLYQNTVTGMRHEWSHPDFRSADAAPDDKSESEAWIRKFAESVGLGYGTLMDGARDWVDSGGSAESYDGNYLSFGGLLESRSVPKEFWDHYYVITRVRGSGSFFSCSC